MASKGRDTEKRFVDIAKLAGWETYLPPKAKYRNQDVFEEFDVLLFRPPDRLRAVQLKTNHVSGITNWFARIKRYAGAFEAIGFAVLEESEGWRYAEPGHDPTDERGDGYEWVYDGREGGPRRPEAVDRGLTDYYLTQTIESERDSQIDGPDVPV